MKKKLRIISVIMFIIAILFLIYALMHPEGGSVFYIWGQPIGSHEWRSFYGLYLMIMIGLFIISCFCQEI